MKRPGNDLLPFPLRKGIQN